MVDTVATLIRSMPTEDLWALRLGVALLAVTLAAAVGGMLFSGYESKDGGRK